jgi:hypothetical protein
MKKLFLFTLLTLSVIFTNAQEVLYTTNVVVVKESIQQPEEDFYLDIHKDIYNEETEQFYDYIVDSFTGDVIFIVERLVKNDVWNGLYTYFAHFTDLQSNEKFFVRIMYNDKVYAIVMNENNSLIFKLNDN